MENTSNYFAEDLAGFATLEAQHSNFDLFASNTPEPEDDDEDSNEEEAEDQGGNSGTGSDDGNTPLDKDIVHSPLTPDPGGKPKK